MLIKLWLSTNKKTDIFIIVTKAILLLVTVSMISNCASNKVEQESKTPEPIKTKLKPTSLSNEDLEQYQEAKSALDTNDYKRAKSLLINLNKKHPSNASIQTNLAITYYNTDMFEHAKKHADLAYSLDPVSKQNLNLLGLIAVKNNTFQEAESFYKKAIKIDKSYAYAHYNLALLYDIYYQDVDRAYDHYNKYLSLVKGVDEEVKNWVEQLKYSLSQ